MPNANPPTPGDLSLVHGNGISLITASKDGVLSEVLVADAVEAYLRESWTTTLGIVSRAEKVSYTPEVVLRPGENRVASLDISLGDEHEVLEELLSGAAFDVQAPRDLNDDILFYALVSDTTQGRTAMVKKRSPSRGASAGKAWMLPGERLDRLRLNPWQLDSTFDVVYTSTGGYALNTHFFEQLIADSPRLRAKIGPWVDDIRGHLRMSEASSTFMRDACASRPRLRRRLRAIAHRGHLGGGTVTLSMVESHLTAMGYTPTDYVENDELVVNNENIDTVLKVLNEDLALGPLTRERFVIESKEALA